MKQLIRRAGEMQPQQQEREPLPGLYGAKAKSVP
jgi:hypothetical protein